MVIKEITISRSTRINLGNYEGIEVLTSMTAVVDELDDDAEIAAQLAERVEGASFMQIKALHKRRRKAVTDAELAKRYGVKA